jgi:hypothetical protein
MHGSCLIMSLWYGGELNLYDQYLQWQEGSVGVISVASYLCDLVFLRV